VIAPTDGAGGASGAGFISTPAVASDVHPPSVVTVKLYVPGRRSVTIVVVPVPAIDPGLIVHVPEEGRPLKETLPVGTAQEDGCDTVPTTGMEGIPGGESMSILTDGEEMHPAEFVTVKL
jgi:hypothetical protein